MIKNPHLSTLLKGIKRDQGVQVKQALPITPDILLQIRSVIDLSAPYWATFWAACVCFSQKEQLVSIKRSQSFYICKQSKIINRQLCIVLVSTKTIQFKQRKVILPLPIIFDHPLCPTTAIKQMQDLSPAQQGADPLLQFMTPAGLKPLLYSGFIKDLRILLTRDSRGFILWQFIQAGRGIVHAPGGCTWRDDQSHG